MSKKYHVYGIGNALVDMEYEVTEEELKGLGVDKGLMTLIEESRQAELLEKLWREPKDRACGGSAANTITAVSQLGGNAFYSCRVASDESGDFYFNNLVASGVDTNLQTKARVDGVTGKCLVMITPDAERTMNTFLGVTAQIGEEDLVEEAILDSEWIYLEGYLAPSPTGKAAAIRAREIAEKNGVKTSLTLSDPNMVNFCKKELQEMLGSKVDLLFCNEKEAMDFCGVGSVEEAAQAMNDKARSWVITMGKLGALVYDGSKQTAVAGQSIEAVDSNGAGDMFAGAFLYAINHGYDFAQAAELANRAAAKVVSQFGPRLNASEAQALLGKSSVRSSSGGASVLSL